MARHDFEERQTARAERPPVGRPMLRPAIIAIMAFATLVDLFATQAILPALTRRYQVSAAAMGLAVNASTLGMAAAGLVVALLSHRLDRRVGIVASLSLLAIPTAALAAAPNLATFAMLRIAQGLCMASAFALTLSYLGERCSAADLSGAFAGYITGNVASNLLGRLMSAALVDHLGVAANFYVFAGLNLAGAALAYAYIAPTPSNTASAAPTGRPLATLAAHLRSASLRAAFTIGFLILFAFIGTFTYVNFVLARPPISIGMMALGFVYFVFLPSIFTTPLAGRAVRLWGTRPTLWAALSVAGIGLPLLLSPTLTPILAGLVLVGVGTFFAQAAATGFVGQAAVADRGSASGLYLACYFFGGLVGTAILGQLFDRFGWSACVTGIAIALSLAALLTARLVIPPAQGPAVPGR